MSFFGIEDLHDMAMDQYLYIPFLGGWTSIYQLFWCSPGVQGFDTLPHEQSTDSMEGIFTQICAGGFAGGDSLATVESARW